MKVHRAESDCDFDEVSTLLHEYSASLDLDLSFQGFEEEIATLPGKYAWPKGALFLSSDTGGARSDAWACVLSTSRLHAK
jgi:hypothetical protein